MLPEAAALIPRFGRLPGVDGKAKMSKSQGNAISLAASPEQVKEAVMRMYTDANHLKVSDPGQVEGNVVFTYLDAFDEAVDEVAELKAHYRRGGLGDMVLKRRLDGVLQGLLAPIRERREELAKDPASVFDILKQGTAQARLVTQATLDEVREALGTFRF